MRLRAFFGAFILLESTSLAAADERSACELMPQSLVSSVVGQAIRAVERDASSGGFERRTCAYAV